VRPARWGPALGAVALAAGVGCGHGGDTTLTPVQVTEVGGPVPAQDDGDGVAEGDPVAEDGFYPVTDVALAQAGMCPAGMAGAAGNQCFTLGPGRVGLDAVDGASVEPRTETQVTYWVVLLHLTDDGIDRFNELAQLCYEQASPDCATGQLALVVGGRVRSAPAIEQPQFEADQVPIFGAGDEAEIRALAQVMAG
jgi:hypothetical protein